MYSQCLTHWTMFSISSTAYVSAGKHCSGAFLSMWPLSSRTAWTSFHLSDGRATGPQDLALDVPGTTSTFYWSEQFTKQHRFKNWEIDSAKTKDMLWRKQKQRGRTHWEPFLTIYHHIKFNCAFFLESEYSHVRNWPPLSLVSLHSLPCMTRTILFFLAAVFRLTSASISSLSPLPLQGKLCCNYVWLNSIVKLDDHSHAHMLKFFVPLVLCHTLQNQNWSDPMRTSINSHHQAHLLTNQHLYPCTLPTPLHNRWTVLCPLPTNE